jgi:UDP-N-acetylglucosamine 4,6-dehydratase
MDLKKIYKNKSILITGGTGSFGKKFVEEILKYHKYIKRLVVFSRDELKQYELSKVYPNSNFTKLRFFIGDIRDKERLSRALKDINIVVHAAALKQVPTAEYNPFECIKTNIIGAQNLIEASLDNGIEKLIALSTDKAVSPINLYGATKLCADKLFVAANNIKGKNNIKFSVVRYGNVTSSRGSVIPFFKTLKNEKYLPVTHKDMTRFNISLNEAFELVNYGIQNMQGGEIFVPKLKSYSVVSLAKAMYPNKKIKFIGIRDGEKIHEDLVLKHLKIRNIISF